MNDSTAEAILQAARQAFAEKGYRGASIREITQAAGANLGAVTYHFGSKDALYLAVLEETLFPFKDRLAAVATGNAPPLDKITEVLRTVFQHLAENPEIPRLILQQLVSDSTPPPPVTQAMQANIGLIAKLIREGQADGSIRSGDPMLMALAVGSQPIFMALMRSTLAQVMQLDQLDPDVREQIVLNSVNFVRHGLAVEKTP